MQVQTENPAPAVVCGFCNHKNAAASKFCGECGAALQLMLCPGCEAVNDRSFARCYKCGTELSPSPEAIAASPEVSGSAALPPADAASELPPVEPSWTPSPSTSPWRTTVPESTGLALESMSAMPGHALEVPQRERLNIPLHPSSPSRRTTSGAFVVIGLLAFAAIAYVGYRNGSFAPISTWLESRPAYQALVAWVERAIGPGSAISGKPAAYAPTSATASDVAAPQEAAALPSATAPAPPQVTATAPESPSDRAMDQTPASSPNTLSAAPTPPPAASPTAAPEGASNPNTATACSAAAAAMGLCTQQTQ